MQKLKNKTTGEEFVITGSIGVPREVEENVFEVWTHFSIDLNGDGQIDTVEIHPESTEWEVIEVADVVPEPEPTPEPEPVIITPSADELARQEWFKRKSALAQMIDDMERARKIGMEPDANQTAIMQGLATWINANMKQEYYF